MVSPVVNMTIFGLGFTQSVCLLSLARVKGLQPLKLSST